MRNIPYGRQSISEEDIQAVVDVLKSDYLTQGPRVPAFEKAIAEYCGAKHAIAVNSATAGLHIACLALGVKKGDTVWTSPVTFVASANCALYCEANIDFVDIDPQTFNISISHLEAKLITARQANKLPKAIVVVHMCGQPCEMEPIFSLSREYGFKVIEDASHAIGSRYKGSITGSCKFSDITIFSFHPVKIITTGEGGMVVTNNAKVAHEMRLLRSHGITRESAEMVNPVDAGWYYEQVRLGFNYRITDIQAALGLNQMKSLDVPFIESRLVAVDRYTLLLTDLPVLLPTVLDGVKSSFHLYIIQLRLEQINLTRDQVFQSLREVGIGVNLHYIPVYLQPYYQSLGFERGYCPNAEAYYARAMSLPMYSALSSADQEYVADNLRRILNQ